MKFKFQIVALSVFVATCAALFAAFAPTTQAVRTFDTPDGQSTVVFGMDGKEDQIYKVWTHDTLTTTENDTLALGYQLASPYQYSYQIKCVKISGTPSLKVVLDSRNTMVNTDWLGVDSISISGADSVRTYFGIRGANTYGLQHRLRLMGTTGTNQYDISALLKKTN